MSSQVKRVELSKLVFWIALTLVVFNYTAGVFVYRSYARKLSSAKAVCAMRFEDGTIHGEVSIEGFDGLRIYPVDYQVYFYDQRGNVLKLVSNSMFGQSKTEFVVSTWTDYEKHVWYAQGYSNVRLEWLWLRVQLYLPLEVKIE